MKPRGVEEREHEKRCRCAHFPISPLAFKFGDPLKGLLSQDGGVLGNRGFTGPLDVWHTAIKRLDKLP